MSNFSKLKKRKEFVRVAKSGVSIPTRTIVIQGALRRNTEDDKVAHIGYTTTKKIGKAVVRNRCRRRLRAAAALFFGNLALAQADYVLIARYNTADADFNDICRDLQYGIKKLNQTLSGETSHDKQDSQASISVTD